MEKTLYWIWLSRLQIDGVNLKKLFQNFIQIENIWNAKEEELQKIVLNKNYVKNILDAKYKQNLEKYLEYMVKNQIEVITFLDEKYPSKLKQIYDFPRVIFTKGDSSILKEEGYAIVGCRDSSFYGENVAKMLSYRLSKGNKVIISGLARGIDKYAHLGCLEARGQNNSSAWG